MGTSLWICMVRSKNSCFRLLQEKVFEFFFIIRPTQANYPFNSVFQLFNPSEFMEDLVIEHEYVECTSSVIQALVMFKQLYPDHRTKEIDRTIEKAVQFIENTQEADGSWYYTCPLKNVYISKANHN